MRSLCGVWCSGCRSCDTLTFTSKSQIVAFVRREWDGVSVCLSRGFVGLSSALHPCSHHFWIRSFWTASVDPADKHPAAFLTPEPSTAVFPVCCGTVISQSSCLSHLSVCLLFLPAPFNRDPASLYQRALLYQWALSCSCVTVRVLNLTPSK